MSNKLANEFINTDTIKNSTLREAKVMPEMEEDDGWDRDFISW